MGPDEEKKLRQLLLLKRQLPEPDWNLINRATKRFGRFAERGPTMESQAATGAREQQRIDTKRKKDEETRLKQEQAQREKQQKEDQEAISRSIKRYNEEKKAFQQDLNRENSRLNKLKRPESILKRAEIIKQMNKNFEYRYGK